MKIFAIIRCIWVIILLLLISSSIKAETIGDTSKIDTIFHSDYKFEIRYKKNTGYFLINFIDPNKKSVIVDTFGNVIETEFDTLYHEEYAPTLNKFFCKKDSLIAIYSFENKERISPFYSSIELISDSFYYSNIDSLGILFNSNNEILVEDPLYKFYDFIPLKDTLAGINNFKKLKNYLVYNIIDKYGNEKYEYLRPRSRRRFNNFLEFKNGESLILKDTLVGLISKEGDIIIEPLYNKIVPWHGKYYYLQMDNKYSLVDNQGATIFPFETREISRSENFLIFKEKSLHNVFDKNLNLLFRDKIDCFKRNRKYLACSSQLENIYVAQNEGFYKVYRNLDTLYSVSGNIYAKKEVGKFEELFDITNDNTIYSATSKKETFEKLGHNFIKITRENASLGAIDKKGNIVLPFRNKSSIYSRDTRDNGGFLYRESGPFYDLYNSHGIKIKENVSMSTTGYHHYVVRIKRKSGIMSDEGKLLLDYQNLDIQKIHFLNDYYLFRKKRILGHNTLFKVNP